MLGLFKSDQERKEDLWREGIYIRVADRAGCKGYSVKTDYCRYHFERYTIEIDDAYIKGYIREGDPVEICVNIINGYKKG